jgi:Family of unknown function (DUF6364)
LYRGLWKTQLKALMKTRRTRDGAILYRRSSEFIPGNHVPHIPCYTYYVAKNLTLTLDEDLLRSARKVALDRNTSVNQLVREYLTRLTRETDERRAALARTERIFRTTRLDVGPQTWRREDLHERR